MKKVLDFIGSFFVYKSPKPYEGFTRFLEHKTSKELRLFTGITAHYSKKKLIKLYLERNNVYTEIQD